MGYAIICNARKGHNLGVDVLGLVDRSKSKRLWWTSDAPNLLLIYQKRDAADFAAKRLRKNKPRVVPADEARRLLTSQSRNICRAEIEADHAAAMAEAEAGARIWRTRQRTADGFFFASTPREPFATPSLVTTCRPHSTAWGCSNGWRTAGPPPALADG